MNGSTNGPTRQDAQAEADQKFRKEGKDWIGSQWSQRQLPDCASASSLSLGGTRASHRHVLIFDEKVTKKKKLRSSMTTEY
jgi:hypothetical protein